jgi:hypothetical protein
MVNISWLPPDDDGGRDIRKYEIQRSLDNERFVTAGEVRGVYHFVDLDVDNGKLYYYRITSYNSEDANDESPVSPVITATPLGVPKSPIDFDWKATTDEVKLTWEAPGNSGGSPITGYILYKGGSEDDLSIIAYIDHDTFEYSDKDVTEGTYYYRLEARNNQGIGEGEIIKVDVPSRFSYIFLVILISLILPIIIFVLMVVVPRVQRKRREEEERRKAEEEQRKKQEEIKREKLLAETSTHHAFSPAPMAQGLSAGSPTALPSPPDTSQRVEQTKEESGYIRPSERKKKKKDKKTVLRSDGKSLETRERDHHPVMSAPIKSKSDDRFYEEKRKILEEEAKKVFTGEQDHREEIGEEEIPTVMAPPEYEPAVSEEPEPEEDIPEWGEEIPFTEPPEDDEGVEYDEDLEELEELEEFEDFEE